MAKSTPPSDDADVQALLRHATFVRAAARAAIGRDDMVEDAVQETWAVALEKRPRDQARMRAWLGSIARNKALDLVRRRSSVRRRDARAARDERLPSTASVVERAELGRRVIAAVMALPEPYREAILLRYHDDLTPKQIGEALGVPPETARTRVKRGLVKLRERLDTDHEGDRGRWVLALAPLLPEAGVAAGSAAWVGGLAMKKLLVGAAAVVAVLAVYIAFQAPGAEVAPDDTASQPTLRGVPNLDGGRAGVRERAGDAKRPDDPTMAILHGRVVDVAGRAVAGVAVTTRLVPHSLSPRFPSQLAGPSYRTLATSRSDDRGRFRCAVPREGRSLIVTATPEAPQAGTEVWLAAQRAEYETPTLVVLDGTALEGRVVDDEGAGVAATLALSMYQPTDLPGAGARFARDGIRTGDDGRFRMEGIPAGRLMVAVHVPDHGRWLHAVGMPHATPLQIRIGTAGRASVHGRVRAADGTPVADARVHLTMRAASSQARVERYARSDADGTYRIEGLEAGALERVAFGADGFAPRWHQARKRPIDAGTSIEIDAVLLRGATLEGHAHDRAGRPIADASIRATVYGGGTSDTAEARTDAAGHYRIQHLPAGGSASIAVRKEGYYQIASDAAGDDTPPPATASVTLGAEGSSTTAELVVVAGVAVAGRVLDQAGAPVASALVRLEAVPRQPTGQLATAVQGLTLPPGRTDAEGRFQFTGLPPQALCRVTAVQGDLRAVATDVRAGGGSAIELRLAPHGTIEARVLTPDGEGVAGMRVSLDGADTGLKTGAAGHLTLRHLPAGTHRIDVLLGRTSVLAEGGTVEIPPEGGTVTAALTTRPPLVTTGRILRADGTPLTSGRAVLVLAAGRRFVGEFFATDPTGRFTLRHWAAGTYRVRVGDEHAGDPFELGSQDLELRVRRPGGSDELLIRILDPTGAPVPRCTLQVMTGTSSGKSGTHEEVDGGVYVLSKRALREVTDVRVLNPRGEDGSALDLAPLEMAGVDTSRDELILRLARGGVIEGRVEDPEGAPAAGVRVQAQAIEAGGSASAMTDDAGRFRLQRLPPGRIMVVAGGNGPWLQERREVAPGAKDVHLVLGRGERLTVEVVGPAGETVANARVEAWPSVHADSTGHWYRRATTDARGRAVLTGIPPGMAMFVDVGAEKADPSLPATRRDPVRASSGPLRVVLARPHWIEGVALGPDGKPAGGTHVTVLGQLEPRRFGVRVSVRTDPETGAFRLGPLERGTYRLGAKGGVITLDVKAPAEGIRIQLPAEGMVEGRLAVDTTKDWSVLWYVGIHGIAAQLGPDGRFRIAAPDLPGMLWAQGPDGRHALREGIRPRDGPFTLTPEAGGVIRGRFAGQVPGDTPLFVTAARGQITVGATVEADGSFEITGVPAGAFRLTVGRMGKELGVVEGVTRDGDPVVVPASD